MLFLSGVVLLGLGVTPDALAAPGRGAHVRLVAEDAADTPVAALEPRRVDGRERRPRHR
jgi:hypothetical protein